MGCGRDVFLHGGFHRAHGGPVTGGCCQFGQLAVDGRERCRRRQDQDRYLELPQLLDDGAARVGEDHEVGSQREIILSARLRAGELCAGSVCGPARVLVDPDHLGPSPEGINHLGGTGRQAKDPYRPGLDGDVSVAAVHGYREHRAGRRISGDGHLRSRHRGGTGGGRQKGGDNCGYDNAGEKISCPRSLHGTPPYGRGVCLGDRAPPCDRALPRRAWSLATGQATWLSPRPELTEGRQLRDSAGFAPDFADQ